MKKRRCAWSYLFLEAWGVNLTTRKRRKTTTTTQSNIHTYLVVACRHGEGPETVGDGVLVGIGLAAALVGVDRGDHADEVLVQPGRLVRSDDALGCKRRLQCNQIRYEIQRAQSDTKLVTASRTVTKQAIEIDAVALISPPSSGLIGMDG